MENNRLCLGLILVNQIRTRNVSQAGFPEKQTLRWRPTCRIRAFGGAFRIKAMEGRKRSRRTQLDQDVDQPRSQPTPQGALEHICASEMSLIRIKEASLHVPRSISYWIQAHLKTGVTGLWKLSFTEYSLQKG